MTPSIIRRALATAACGLLIPVTLTAHEPPPTAPSGLLIADGGLGGILEIVSHDVRVSINNGVAVTTIDQVFHNTEGRIVEALYTFPVPKNASIANFSMWIGGKEMVGEVVEKQRARQIYNSYKRVNRDPGLLEQVDYKTFEMRIFPIPADAKQRVRVEYYQELDVDDDWCTYVYPLATTTRPGLDSSVKGRFSLTLEVKSLVPITGMQSTSHTDEFIVVDHGEGLREASLEVTGGDLGRDVVISWQLERAQTGLDFVTSKTKGEDGFLLVTLTAGKELERTDTGMDYVFVSDISGSMADAGKLGVSQGQLRAFVEALGPKDRFEMISFNLAATTLFGRLQAMDEAAKTRAATFLRGQRARGGTRLRPALEAAFRYVDKDRPLNIVVLSDGLTEQSEQRELLVLLNGRPARARMFCIGVGNDVNRPLLRQVAQSTGGLAAFLSRGDDFSRQAKAFRRKLMRPAIADVQILIEGVPVHGAEPQQVPNLYHGAPVRLYARYKRAGKATVTLRGTLEGATFTKVCEVELPEVAGDNPEIERMWAWHRVQGLMDQQRRDGDNNRHREEIVRLCEGFSIASEYASFLVLENDAEYQRWKIERRNATRLTRDRNARQKLQRRLAKIRSEAATRIGPQAEPMPESAPRPAPRQPSNQVSSRPAPQQPPNHVSSRPTPRNQRPRRQPTRRRRRSSGGSGGGAIDPVTGGLALGFIALAAARRRRNRPQIES